MKQKVTIEVDVPEGYEATGEFRPPKEEETFLCEGTAVVAHMYFATEKIILRRVKQYREPVLPADYGKQCEFSDDKTQWFHGVINGWFKAYPDERQGQFSERNWSMLGSGYYRFCRIEKEST